MLFTANKSSVLTLSKSNGFLAPSTNEVPADVAGTKFKGNTDNRPSTSTKSSNLKRNSLESLRSTISFSSFRGRLLQGTRSRKISPQGSDDHRRARSAPASSLSPEINTSPLRNSRSNCRPENKRRASAGDLIRTTEARVIHRIKSEPRLPVVHRIIIRRENQKNKNKEPADEVLFTDIFTLDLPLHISRDKSELDYLRRTNEFGSDPKQHQPDIEDHPKSVEVITEVIFTRDPDTDDISDAHTVLRVAFKEAAAEQN